MTSECRLVTALRLFRGIEPGNIAFALTSNGVFALFGIMATPLTWKSSITIRSAERM